MKTSFLALIFTLAASHVFSQDFSVLKDAKLQNKEDYKAAEATVLELANYLFQNPAQKDEVDRLGAVRFIIRWMEGTPEYTFSIGQEAMEVTKGNDELAGLYFAAMSKVVLESPQQQLSDAEITGKAIDILVDYVSNEDNGIKPNKAIKKRIKSKG